MAEKTTSSWRSVRTPFLVAGAVALIGFGVVFGVAFDWATRPAKPVAAIPNAPSEAPRPSRQFQRPTLPPGADDASSILQRPSGEPRRAWAETGASPLVAFAMPTAVPPQRPAVAIVIDDMGLDRPRALRTIALPGPLTLSLMTYADGLMALSAQARSAGHEVMAHLPMEPLDPKENPGRGALLVKMDEALIRQNIAAGLDDWKGYVGINNHMGSKFTADKARMAIVMEELKARGLMWLDSKTTQDSAGPGAAKAANVPFVERDFFLDNIDTLEAVNAQLDQVEAMVKSHGTAIAIGHPHDATIAALKVWLPGLEARGISLVPVTEILKRRTEARRPG